METARPPTPPSAASPTIQIDRSWDEALFETEALRPSSSVAVLLTWSMEPPPIDAGVPPAIIEIVSQVVTSIGPVAFRLFFPDDLPAGLTRLPASRPWWPIRLYQRLAQSWPADLALARQAAAAAELFSQDWQLQGQAALVLTGDSASEQTLGRLRRSRDWRDAGFPKDARLLIGPAVDGDGIVMAAASMVQIDQVVSLLLLAFEEAGFSVYCQPATGASEQA